MGLRFTIIDNNTGSSQTLIDEPVGLDAITLHLGRDKNYHGFFDQIDDRFGDLQFYGDGFKILSAAYRTSGVDADLQLLIEFSCDDSGLYDTLYVGQFDFSRYKESVGANGCHLEIPLENSRGLQLLKNRMDQNVPLDSLKCHDDGYPSLRPYDGLGLNIILPGKTIKLLNYATYNDRPAFYEQT